MAHGDFENYTDYHQQPTGYTSDYEYLPFDPYGTDLYDKPQYQGKSGVYLLSNNAKHTWRDYANVVHTPVISSQCLMLRILVTPGKQAPRIYTM